MPSPDTERPRMVCVLPSNGSGEPPVLMSVPDFVLICHGGQQPSRGRAVSLGVTNGLLVGRVARQALKAEPYRCCWNVPAYVTPPKGRRPVRIAIRIARTDLALIVSPDLQHADL